MASPGRRSPSCAYRASASPKSPTCSSRPGYASRCWRSKTYTGADWRGRARQRARPWAGRLREALDLLKSGPPIEGDWAPVMEAERALLSIKLGAGLPEGFNVRTGHVDMRVSETSATRPRSPTSMLRSIPATPMTTRRRGRSTLASCRSPNSGFERWMAIPPTVLVLLFDVLTVGEVVSLVKLEGLAGKIVGVRVSLLALKQSRSVTRCGDSDPCWLRWAAQKVLGNSLGR